MNNTRAAFSVEVTRVVDDAFPTWVSCNCLDAGGTRHEIIEKLPVLGIEESNLPTQTQIFCEILKLNDDGTTTVTTARPWAVESTAGVSVFKLLNARVESRKNDAP